MFRILKYLLLILLVAAPVSAKYWNGSAWVDDTCNYYNGTSFVPCSEFYYNGTAWVPVNDGTPPVTYSLDLTITDSDGDDTVTVDGTAYTSSTIITGLDSATETLTGGFGSAGTNDTVVCTGTAVSGTSPNYTIDMSDSNESAECTFSTAGGSCPTGTIATSSTTENDEMSMSNTVGQSFTVPSNITLYSITFKIKNSSGSAADFNVRIGTSSDLSGGDSMEEITVSVPSGSTREDVEFLSSDHDSFSSSTTYYIGIGSTVGGPGVISRDTSGPYANGNMVYSESSNNFNMDSTSSSDVYFIIKGCD